MIDESRATHGSRSSRMFQTSARRPSGTEHAGDLGERERVVEPVERLRARDDVREGVGQRDDLGAAEGAERAGSGDGQELQHLRQRLDRGNAMTERDERAGQLARARAEVDDVARLVAGEPADGLLRVPGTSRGRTRRRPRRRPSPDHAPSGRERRHTAISAATSRAGRRAAGRHRARSRGRRTRCLPRAPARGRSGCGRSARRGTPPPPRSRSPRAAPPPRRRRSSASRAPTRSARRRRRRRARTCPAHRRRRRRRPRPASRVAATTASRLRSDATSTRSQRSAAVTIARVPFVVEMTSVAARGSTYSRGELPRSKPGIRTAFRSPPSDALAELLAERSRLLDLGRAEHPLVPGASAWQIVEVARMTSMTMPVGAAAASSGVKRDVDAHVGTLARGGRRALRCYRHPDRETHVSCSECGRGICPDCMTFAPVGIRCPEHASTGGRTPLAEARDTLGRARRCRSRGPRHTDR